PPARRRPGAPRPPSAPPPQQRCEPSRGARSPATRVATSRPPGQRQPPTRSAPSAHRPPANHHRPTASAQFRACAGAHYLVKATFARISPTEWPKAGSRGRAATPRRAANEDNSACIYGDLAGRRPGRPQHRHLTWNGITARPWSSATRKGISALVGAGREWVVRVVAEADEGGAVAPQGLH